MIQKYACSAFLIADAAERNFVVALLLVVGTAAVAYIVRLRAGGPISDEDASRHAVGGWLETRGRTGLGWLLGPVARALARAGISPNLVTVFSLVPALFAGWYAAQGRFAVAGALYLFAGACDFLDGRLARCLGRTTQGGALLDSVLDRYGECALLTGLAWYYRGSWVSAAVVCLISGSLMVSYIRARSEGLGLNVTTGLMQRPERVVLLGLAAILTPLFTIDVGDSGRPPEATLLVGCIVFLAAMSHATAIHRLRHAARELDRAAESPVSSVPNTFAGRESSRQT